MLPDLRPPQFYSAEAPATQDIQETQLATSYALTLFTLGAMAGLLALVGRIAQEIQSRVLTLTPARGSLSWATVGYGDSMLLPMLRDLDDPVVRLIALGFAVCAVGIGAGAALWSAAGSPATPRDRRRVWLGAWIVVWLLTGMVAALVTGDSAARITLLIAAAALALAGYVALVILTAADALRG